MGIVDNWNNTIKLGSRFKSSLIKYDDVCVESLFEIATLFFFSQSFGGSNVRAWLCNYTVTRPYK